MKQPQLRGKYIVRSGDSFMTAALSKSCATPQGAGSAGGRNMQPKTLKVIAERIFVSHMFIKIGINASAFYYIVTYFERSTNYI